MKDISRREFINQSATGFLAAGTPLGGTNAFAKNGGKRKPNVVYVLTDQWRAQATGYAGDPNVKTPSLDTLASRSVNFENAVSVCPVCAPHRASLMTGRYPLTTGTETSLRGYSTLILSLTR
jgi:arylsulfatase A-like enzyme